MELQGHVGASAPQRLADMFEARLARLDISLFSAIKSQSTNMDKESWLALQLLARANRKTYSYLEIGSYLGGSIQPYLLDPRCAVIYSIDKRQENSRDDRGPRITYPDGSRDRMLANLRGLHAGHAMKVLCFDAGVRDLLPSVVVDRPSACFIDGEHTAAAVFEDFNFCFKVCAADAIIYFHDANVVYPAIERILRRLDQAAVAYRAMKMGGSTFAIALGERPDADRDLRYLATSPQQFFWTMRRRRLGRLVRSLLRVAPD